MPLALTISGTWAKRGGARFQGRVECQLERRVDVVVGAADHVGDAHVDVVHHDGQVVERAAVAAADDAVADLGRVLAARTEDDVVPGEPAALGQAQPHRVRPAVGAVPGVAAAAVVGPLAARGDGRRLSRFELLPGADAAVGASRRDELVEHLGVARGVLALPERALVPAETQPLEQGEQGGLGLGRGALLVGVLHAQHEPAPMAPREGPVEQGGSRIAQVEKPRGARGESGADLGHGGAG